MINKKEIMITELSKYLRGKVLGLVDINDTHYQYFAINIPLKFNLKS